MSENIHRQLVPKTLITASDVPKWPDPEYRCPVCEEWHNPKGPCRK